MNRLAKSVRVIFWRETFRLATMEAVLRVLLYVAKKFQVPNWMKGSYLVSVGYAARGSNEFVARTQITPRAIGREVVHDRLGPIVLGLKGEAEQVRATVDDLTNCAKLLFVREWWINKNFAENAEDAEWVYQRIALDGPAALGRPRLKILLRLAGRVSYAWPEAKALLVVKKCILLARQQIDPYADSSVPRAASAALSIILARRPELDAEFIGQTLRANPHFPQMLDVMGTALRNRPNDGGSTFKDVATRWSLAHDEIARLAERASPSYLYQPTRLPKITGGRYSSRIYETIRKTLPAILSVGLASLLAVGAQRVTGRGPTVPLDPAGALALLALVVTANVFVVQLSTTRLPGAVARVTGQPWQLTSCYAAIALMLVGVYRKPVDPEYLQFTQWLGLTALVVFLLALLLALPSMLSRTDEARAVEAFVRQRGPSFKASGARFGVLQGAAVRVEDFLKASPVVRTSGSQAPGERATIIRASRRGLLLPSRRRLQALLSNPAFESGMRLRTLVPFGTVSEQGAGTVGLLPGTDQSVDSALEKSAHRAFRVRSSLELERASSAIVTLYGLSLKLNNEGDVGTASSVGESATRLLNMHVSAARSTRSNFLRRRTLASSRVLDDDTSDNFGNASIIPAMRDSASVLMRARLDVNDQRTYVVDSLIESFLRVGGPADIGAAAVIGWLPSTPDGPKCGAEGLTSIAKMVGVRSLETSDRIVFDMTISYLLKLGEVEAARRFSIETMTALVALSVRFDVTFAERSLPSLLAAAKKSDGSVAPAKCLWVVGASGLAHQSYKVAEMARNRIESENFSSAIQVMGSTESYVRAEEFRAKMSGLYLGDSGADALANFSSYCARLAEITVAAP